MVVLAQTWTTVGPQHQCVHTMLTESRLEGRLKSVFLCKQQQGFSFITSTGRSIMPPHSLKAHHSILLGAEEVAQTLSAARLFVYFCSHTTLTTLPSTCQTCRDIGNKLVFSKSVDACWGQPEYVRSLEHVQAHLTLSHNQRGKLAIHLVSPLGTRSTLLFPR